MPWSYCPHCNEEVDKPSLYDLLSSEDSIDCFYCGDEVPINKVNLLIEYVLDLSEKVDALEKKLHDKKH